MIVLTPNKTTGKQVYKIIMDAVRKHAKETNLIVTGIDFCRAAEISKQTLHRYKNGIKPGSDSLVKIATGLKKWGNEVEINISI